METQRSNASYLGNGSLVTFRFLFPYQNRIIHEEILIFDEIGLLGSLGGALGMFLGFSLYGYVTTFLDTLLDRLVGTSTSGICSKNV